MKNEFLIKTYTNSSSQSLPEINRQKQTCFKYFYIIVSLINSALGVYLIYNNKKYVLNSFEKYETLNYFVYTYTFIWFIAFICGLIFASFIFLIYKSLILCNVIKQRINADNQLEEEYSILSYTIVSFYFGLVTLYTLAIPYGIYLIRHMIKDKSYMDFNRFYFVYLYIFINIFLGVFLISIFIYVFIFIHIRLSSKQKINLDEEMIQKAEKEIFDSTKISGTIPQSRNLIKVNSYMNKQEQAVNQNLHSILNNSGSTSEVKKESFIK